MIYAAGWHGQRVHGFTLIEMSVSLLVISILLVGIGSTVLLAGRAIPDADGHAARLYATHRAAEQVLGDVHQAMYVTERTQRAIAFVVADRTKDGRPETIRYSWSGTAGDPLMLRYNGVERVLLRAVERFDLDYDTASVTETYAGPPVETSEQTLSQNDPSLLGVTGLLTSNWQVRSSEWVGHSFMPSPPAGATAISITRVAVYAKGDGGGSGDNLFQIYRADNNGLPAGTPYASVTVPESTLGQSGLLGLLEHAWETVSLPARNIPLGNRICFVVRHAGSGSSSGYFQYDNGGSGRIYTTNSGQPWSGPTGDSLQHYIYGTYSIRGTPQQITRTHLTRVGIRIKSAADTAEAAPQIIASTPLMNMPEVLAAVWEADFSADPTQLDFDADGLGDWATADNSAFNTASLALGAWTIDKTLVTWPGRGFIVPTVVEARLRATSTAGNGVFIAINADSDGSTYMPIIAKVQLMADGTQTVTVLHHTSDASPQVAFTAAGLGSGFVDVRLLIDPTKDTCNVQINRIEHGTFRYTPYSGGNSSKRYASVYASNTTGQVDYVRVKVGGTP